jgi:hypothetical protein
VIDVFFLIKLFFCIFVKKKVVFTSYYESNNEVNLLCQAFSEQESGNGKIKESGTKVQ